MNQQFSHCRNSISVFIVNRYHWCEIMSCAAEIQFTAVPQLDILSSQTAVHCNSALKCVKFCVSRTKEATLSIILFGVVEAALMSM